MIFLVKVSSPSSDLNMFKVRSSERINILEQSLFVSKLFILFPFSLIYFFSSRGSFSIENKKIELEELNRLL